MTKVTVSEAAVLTGKSRQTINDATKDGTLSFDKNKRGHKVIDIAELSRVFDIIGTLEEGGTVSKPVKSDSKSTVRLSDFEKEILSIKEELVKSHEREKSLMKEQIELPKTYVEEARHDKQNYMRLLEDHSKGDGHSKSELEKKVNEVLSANDDLKTQLNKLMDREEVRQKRIEARRARAEQKENQIQDNEPAEPKEGRGLWKKMFG